MASQSKEIQEGMHVTLMENDTDVAEGTIFTMDPSRYYHNQILGDGYVSISLKVVYDKPTNPSHNYLLEHVGSFVRWKKSNLRPQLTGAPNVENHAFSPEVMTSRPQLTGAPNVENHAFSPEVMTLPRENSHKFNPDDRSTWAGNRVIVLDKENNKLGFAFIVVAFTNEVVDSAYLGENDLGITAFEMMVDDSSFEIGKLMRWPIKNLILLNGESLLGEKHIIDEEVTNVGGGMKKYKRPYRFIKRKRAKLVVKKAKADPCDMENIAIVASIDCCPKHCCQYANREKILIACTEYHSLKFDDQTTFTYDSFAASVKGEDGKYEGMLFDGNVICCKGWYTIYGICKATFYNRRNKWLNGAKKGMHGNKLVKRSTERMEAAKVALTQLVDVTANQMPHRSRITSDGERDYQKVMPPTYNMMSMLKEVNESLSMQGLPHISQSSFSRLWNEDFKDVLISRENTSKCETCTDLKNRLESTKNPQEREILRYKMDRHNMEQRSCRNIYYSWRYLSFGRPQEFLCLIHDKMDQKKTCIPRLKPNPNTTKNAMQLPMALAGILTHGHGPASYGHFATWNWSFDPNFTIGSIAKCLRNLENYNVGDRGDLTPTFTSAMQPLHKALLTRTDGKELTKVEHHDFKPLPKVLLLQVDNCVSENKNRFVLAYLAMLVARGHFKEIVMAFLMVGHTHEDIDAFFSRFGDSIRKRHAHIFPQLFEMYETCVSARNIPYLIQEVPNFKKFVDGYIEDGRHKLVGHTKPLHFRLYLDGKGDPRMQYKVHPKQATWEPEDGIELFKKDDAGRQILPDGEPEPVPLNEHMREEENIISGISKYIDFWKIGLNGRFGHSKYQEVVQPIITYWENVIAELQESPVRNSKLQDGFCPRSQWMLHHVEDAPIMMTENEEEHHEVVCCGPASGKPKEEFKPEKDIMEGMFLIVRPDDMKETPFWLGAALTNPTKQKDGLKECLRVHIQWWKPLTRGKKSLKDQYNGCCYKRWKPNPSEQRQWVDVQSVIYGWKAKTSAISMKQLEKMPDDVVAVVQSHLELCTDD